MNLQIIEQINETPYKAFFAITGGGQSFIGDYCKVSGASKTVIGAIVPYNQAIFDKFIKKVSVDSYASSDAARKLAVASYNECIEAGVEAEFALGIGATSSLAKTDEREGRLHKIYVAIHSYDTTKVAEVLLRQGRTREHEEDIARYLIYRALANHVLKMNLLVPPNEGFTEDFYKGNKNHLEVLANKAILTNSTFDDDTVVIYSGNWNPIHQGHLKVKGLAEKILGKTVHLELTLNNADKGQLDFISIGDRELMLAPFKYILTGASTVQKKLRILQESLGINKNYIFVMGVDTWNRVWSDGYGYNQEQLAEEFNDAGVKFLVFGRDGTPIKDVNRHLRIPSEEAANFSSSFSSTAIRKSMSKSL